MQYMWKLFLVPILLNAFIGDLQLVSGGWIPSRKSIHKKRQHARSPNLQGVEVLGFGFLEPYVCPRTVDKLQVGSSIEQRDQTTVTIPRDQLQTILQQIRMLEMQIVAMIEMEFDAIESELDGATGTSADEVASSVGVGAVIVTVTSNIWALIAGNGSPATLSDVPGPANAEATGEILEIPSSTSISLESLSAVVVSALQASIPSPGYAPSPTSPPDSSPTTTILETSVCTRSTTITTLQSTITTKTIITVTSILTPSNYPSVDVIDTAAGVSVGCSEDDCLGAFIREGAQEFCSTFTSGIVTSTTDLPSYASACATDNSAIVRASSACSCLADSATDVAAIGTANVDAQSTTVVADTSIPTSRVPSNGGVFLETGAASSSPSTTSSYSAAPSEAAQSSASPSFVSSVDMSPAVDSGSSSSGTSASTPYSFSAQSARNIAVYFGQTPVTSLDSLSKQCADTSIDIVILSFVIGQLDGGIYPSINFGAACGGQTAAMQSQAPGLLSCPQLAAIVQKCQSTYGKKVLLSIGGAASQIAFSSATQASDFADILWKLFGPPGYIDVNLRPFGAVSIDGFDVDNEDNLPSNYDTLASAFRKHFSSTTQKTYYLSSAPQCPFPDASDPLSMLLLCDFVFVQFYNNPPCEIGSTGFKASVQQWSTALQKSTLAVKPRLYVGAPAFSAAGSTAYTHIGDAQGMKKVAADVKGYAVSNLGGVMFWDGSEGLLNVAGGKDIITWAKEGLA